MRTASRLALGAVLLASAGCSTLQGLIPGREAPAPLVVPAPQVAAIAPGAPGDRPVWSSAAKTGAGPAETRKRVPDVRVIKSEKVQLWYTGLEVPWMRLRRLMLRLEEPV